MLFRAPLSFLASAIFFAYAQASYLQDELSFGHHQNERISPHGRAIPFWHLTGKPDPPEILSNKLVLTPPSPGNQRGAIWSEKTLVHHAWTADIDFRATGPERGGGNLQIWYVQNGLDAVGTASVYTVGHFDGLVLVVDQYAGSGGFIRGFLNDGSTDYKSHHSVDSLAFGHCEYSYRNLGRPSRIQMQQSDEKFRVSVDGILCFESTKVKLPMHNFFGITAASAENPDSFEVFKFVTTTEKHEPDWEDPWKEIRDNAAAKAAEMKGFASPPNKHQDQSPNTGDIPAFSDPPETPADKYTSSSEQFADLHNRLQAMTKHINAIGRETSLLTEHGRTRHDYLVDHITKLETQISQLRTLNDMMESIQRDVRQTKEDVHNALDHHVSTLRSQLTASTTSLHETVKLGHGWGRFLLIVFGSQALTVCAYLVYKRRKANSPKKYL